MDLIAAIQQHADRLGAAAARIPAAVVEGPTGLPALTAAHALVRLHRLAADAERLAAHLERATGTTPGRPAP